MKTAVSAAFVLKRFLAIFLAGIYEIHMDLSGVPFLYDELPDGHTELKPKDVMAT